MTIYEKGWTANTLEQWYYEWLTGLIPGWRAQYSVLLRHLYETPFRVTLMMDENRVGDGLGMRSRYVYFAGLGAEERDVLKENRPCSVLEIMAGLAQRFEEEYMSGSSNEHTLETWFGLMIESLGLKSYDDAHFDLYGFDRIMRNLLDRTYSPDGRGSFFYIPGIQDDMRRVEIWFQLLKWNKYRNGGNTNG